MDIRIPTLLEFCFYVPFIILLVVYEYITIRYKKLSTRNLNNKHVVITGGSSGIGKSLARQAASKGANVTIIARNEVPLIAAVAEINLSCASPTQRINHLSLDVSKSYEDVVKAFNELEQEMGPTYMLINCAGSAVCGKLEDTSIEDVKKMLDLNCLGSIYPTKAIIEGMKSRGSGHIVFIASLAAYAGIFGYTAYSCSKYALRGFAEALSMEVRNHGVHVTVAYPPDTDTPGFAEEEKTKPQETRLISQTAGLWKPDDVADKIMKDALAGYFTSVIGMDGMMLSTISAGMTPVSNFFQLVTQVVLMGPLRIVAAFYTFYFDRIIKKCIIAKDKSKKAE